MSVNTEPNFDHLLRMTNDTGTFEHALLAEHGFCTDDMARVLVVTTREPHPTPAVRLLAEQSLRFLSDAQGFDGDYHNRMNQKGVRPGYVRGRSPPSAPPSCLPSDQRTERRESCSSISLSRPVTPIGGCDGVQPDGANRNQGAESTLALLSTLQHARYLVTVNR